VAHESDVGYSQGEAWLSREDCADYAEKAGLTLGIGDYIFGLLTAESGGTFVERETFVRVLEMVLQPRGPSMEQESPDGRRAAKALETDGFSVASTSTAASSSSSVSRRPASARGHADRHAMHATWSPSALDNMSRSRQNYANPTYDSSNFLLALEGGKPLYDEIFLREQGNSFFNVAGAGVEATGGLATTTPRAPRPSSAGVARSSRRSDRKRAAAEIELGRRRSAAMAQEIAAQAAYVAAIQNICGAEAAGKPSWEFPVATRGPRPAHPLTATQDPPRGRAARGAALTFRNHRGELTQDICQTGAPTVAHSFLYPKALR